MKHIREMSLSTCKEESIGVSPDDDVDSLDLLGDLLIHSEAGVTQSDDLIDSQRPQLFDLQLKGAHLVFEVQVWSCIPTWTFKNTA